MRERQNVNVTGTDSTGAGFCAWSMALWAYGFRNDEYFFIKIGAAFPELPDESNLTQLQFAEEWTLSGYAGLWS
jgi:hypothetical protein